MELSSTLQLEQMSLGDTHELFPVPSPTSISPDSSHAPSLASLPPELLSHIFDSFPTHPYYDRVASLSNLCLVNRYFLDLARPLLYHDIHLDLEMDFDWSRSRYNQLYNTLTTSTVCSGLVNHIRISFRAAYTGVADMARLSRVFSHLNSLKSVRTSWWHERKNVKLSAELVRSIMTYQKGLECLEISKVSSVDHKSFKAIFTELPRLKTFIGDLVLPSDSNQDIPLKSSCNLGRLVVTSEFNYSMLKQILYSSHSSLTSFAFRISTADEPLDLSSFPNLSLVRISVYRIDKHTDITALVTRATVADLFNVIPILRSIVNSLKSLPIKTLSVSTHDVFIYHAFKSRRQDELLLDILPPSIVHLGGIVSLFERGEANFSILTDCIRNHSYPHLKRISIFPGMDGDMRTCQYAGGTKPEIVKKELLDNLKELGITVEIVAENGIRAHSGLLLDPWQTDSETESEGDSSDEWEDYD